MTNDDVREQALFEQFAAAEQELTRLRESGASDEEIREALGRWFEAQENYNAAVKQRTEMQRAEQAERARRRADGQDFEAEIGWNE